MGGHGGLNILPQKKWNVYNWDNRIKVEKDKRIAREKQVEKERKQHNKDAAKRIGELKKKQGIKQTMDDSSSSSKSSSKSSSVKRDKNRRNRSPSEEGKQQEIEKKQSNITDEYKKIVDGKKHFNLFEQEEEMLALKENTQAMLEREREFFKDKPFDMSSKFMGSLDDERSKPWYMKGNKHDDKQQEQMKSQIQSFRTQNEQFYQIIEIENKKKLKPNSLYNPQIAIKQEEADQLVKKERKEKSEKIYRRDKKKQEKIQKLAEQLRAMLSEDSIDEDKAKKQQDKERLRKQRIEREKKEREREQRLVAQNYQFDFQRV